MLHNRHRIGSNQCEFKQRQQPNFLMTAIASYDTLETAACKLAVERQQPIEMLRRIGINGISAVTQPFL